VTDTRETDGRTWCDAKCGLLGRVA